MDATDVKSDGLLETPEPKESSKVVRLVPVKSKVDAPVDDSGLLVSPNPGTLRKNKSATLGLGERKPSGLAVKAHDGITKRGVFSKTRMCVYYQAGHCVHDDNCEYAHYSNELRTTPDLVKTTVCEEFLIGRCFNNYNCKFAHGMNELRATPNVYKTSLCRFWMAGKCTSGRACRHAHGDSEMRRPPANNPLVAPSLPPSTNPSQQLIEAMVANILQQQQHQQPQFDNNAHNAEIMSAAINKFSIGQQQQQAEYQQHHQQPLLYQPPPHAWQVPSSTQNLAAEAAYASAIGRINGRANPNTYYQGSSMNGLGVVASALAQQQAAAQVAAAAQAAMQQQSNRQNSIQAFPPRQDSYLLGMPQQPQEYKSLISGKFGFQGTSGQHERQFSGNWEQAKRKGGGKDNKNKWSNKGRISDSYYPKGRMVSVDSYGYQKKRVE